MHHLKTYQENDDFDLGDMGDMADFDGEFDLGDMDLGDDLDLDNDILGTLLNQEHTCFDSSGVCLPDGRRSILPHAEVGPIDHR